ncbi:MAG TPA: hypothetical protein VGR81_05160 [Candidatus Acidoferrales bacterium]|nr:hypothetical protein [Candidatus Acidoferrales bacterium]
MAYAAPGDAFIGTWKLNEAKSKLPAGALRVSTITYTMSGGNITCILAGTDGSGHPFQSSWTGKFDGKSYAVTNSSPGLTDMRSYRLISSHILSGTEIVAGKLADRGRLVVSRDGKTLTVTPYHTGADGSAMTRTTFYDKQ